MGCPLKQSRRLPSETVKCMWEQTTDSFGLRSICWIDDQVNVRDGELAESGSAERASVGVLGWLGKVGENKRFHRMVLVAALGIGIPAKASADAGVLIPRD